MASKCFYHPRVEAEKSCEGCRLSICDTCEQDGLCRECRNKRKAIADRKERMGGGEAGAAPAKPAASPSAAGAENTHTYDPDRVAYRSSSKVYKAMKSSSGPGFVASLTDTRVALTLGLLIGVGVLLFMGSDLLPSSEPEFPAQEVAVVEGEPPPAGEEAAQPEAEPEPVAAATPSPPPVDQAEQQMAAIWQGARRDAEQQTASARAVAVAEDARLAKERAQFEALQRRQAAVAEAESRRRAAEAAALAARQAAALQASRPAPAAPAAAPPPAKAPVATTPAAAAGARPVAENPVGAPPKVALRLLSIDGDERPALKVSAGPASRLRYASPRRMSRARRFAVANPEERFEGRLKPPLVTQW